MKWMKSVVCAALLAVAGPAFSEGAGGIPAGLCLWPVP